MGANLVESDCLIVERSFSQPLFIVSEWCRTYSKLSRDVLLIVLSGSSEEF